MFICHDPKFVYLRPTRTGSTSIQDILSASNRTAEHFGQMHNKEPIRNLEQYYTFTSVRNPFGRAVSMYCFLIPQNFGKTFRQFLETPFNALTQPVSDLVGDWKLDHVIRFENLLEDFKKLPFIDNSLKFPRRNPADYYRAPEDFYGEQEVVLVKEKYRSDFDRFGYSMDFESWLYQR